MNRYDILYTKDFNPNSREYILFRQGVQKEELGTYLISLCKYFYELTTTEADALLHRVYRPEELQEAPAKTVSNVPVTYQCGHCYTQYDQQYGDSENNIPAGTPFEQLPSHYHCPTCDAPKEAFSQVKGTLVEQ
jgi:rubredoxin